MTGLVAYLTDFVNELMYPLHSIRIFKPSELRLSCPAQGSTGNPIGFMCTVEYLDICMTFQVHVAETSNKPIFITPIGADRGSSDALHERSAIK